MATRKGGLGKGLDSLIADKVGTSNEKTDAKNEVMVNINKVEPNKEQPRKNFDEDALLELSESIKQFGVLQPLLVVDRKDYYEIIAGERRWRAAKLAGLSTISAIVKEYDEKTIAKVALIENLQREDLNPIEEAEGLQLLISRYNLTQDEAAARVGRSRPAVANSLRLLKLPDEILEMTKTGDISAGHARALLGFSSKEEMMQTAKEIKDKDLSVREIEKRIQESQKPEKKSARKKKTADVFYSEAELALSNSLGRKVKVIKGRKGGHLEIEFFDKDDLKKLAQELDRAES